MVTRKQVWQPRYAQVLALEYQTRAHLPDDSKLPEHLPTCLLVLELRVQIVLEELLGVPGRRGGSRQAHERHEQSANIVASVIHASKPLPLDLAKSVTVHDAVSDGVEAPHVVEHLHPLGIRSAEHPGYAEGELEGVRDPAAEYCFRRRDYVHQLGIRAGGEAVVARDEELYCHVEVAWPPLVAVLPQVPHIGLERADLACYRPGEPVL